MFNKIALSTLAVTSFAAPAFAGVYVNLEASSSYAGTDYSKTSTDMFVGYEDSVGTLDYFIEGGPSVTTVDGGESDTVPAGKVGFSVKANDHLKVYGELSASFNEGTNDYGTKAGVKYSF
jgi:hypothetical protein|tara:strand:+ start:533 stop:892 length:360 start_codon:yes stop_codon:yes gene_type:complete